MAFPDNNLIISLLATGSADLLENCLIGMQRCEINMSCVHVVIPANASSDLHDVIKRLGTNLRLLEELLGDVEHQAIPADYAEYGTNEFNRLMRVRFPIIQALARECEYIIYSDIDVAWLANPLPYLEQVLDVYPMAFQTEGMPCFPPNFCSGFFAMRTSSSESRELIRLHIARFSDDYPLTMQILMNSLIEENHKFLPCIFPLPEALFANGLLHSIVASRGANPVALTKLAEPFTFHANFTIGSQNKRSLLRQARAWFVVEDSSASK